MTVRSLFAMDACVLQDAFYDGEDHHIVAENAVGHGKGQHAAHETEEVEHFLAGLPELHRRVMQMSMHGTANEEIAELTGLSEVNVRVIISRLRKRFREIYFK